MEQPGQHEAGRAFLFWSAKTC